MEILERLVRRVRPEPEKIIKTPEEERYELLVRACLLKLQLLFPQEGFLLIKNYQTSMTFRMQAASPDGAVVQTRPDVTRVTDTHGQSAYLHLIYREIEYDCEVNKAVFNGKEGNSSPHLDIKMYDKRKPYEIICWNRSLSVFLGDTTHLTRHKLDPTIMQESGTKFYVNKLQQKITRDDLPEINSLLEGLLLASVDHQKTDDWFISVKEGNVDSYKDAPGSTKPEIYWLKDREVKPGFLSILLRLTS